MQIKKRFFEYFSSFCIGIVNRNIQFGVYRHSETRFTRAEEKYDKSTTKPRGKYDKSTRKTMTVFRKRQGETARNAVSQAGRRKRGEGRGATKTRGRRAYYLLNFTPILRAQRTNSTRQTKVARPAIKYPTQRNSTGKFNPSGAIRIYETDTIVMNKAGTKAIK